MAVLAGVDFFTVEVLTWRGLATYYVLFFVHLESRRVCLTGVTRHPTEAWTEQMARNAIDEGQGILGNTGTSCTIVMPSSAPRSDPYWQSPCKMSGAATAHQI